LPLGVTPEPRVLEGSASRSLLRAIQLMRWGGILLLLSCLGCAESPYEAAHGPAASPAAHREDSVASALAPIALPATFRGVLPCADCEGIEHTLTLRPDGSYWQSLRYLGVASDSGDTSLEIGRWSIDSTPERLELRGESEAAELWRRQGEGALRKLDHEGNPIKSSLSYTIHRLPAALEEFGPVRVRGVFRYQADAAVLESCASGARYTVQGGEGYLALERAYLESRPAPGAEMLVTMTARLVPKPAGEEGWPTRMEVVALERMTTATRCEPGDRG
jgi:copper homeostasis protein (lipoprotein)